MPEAVNDLFLFLRPALLFDPNQTKFGCTLRDRIRGPAQPGARQLHSTPVALPLLAICFGNERINQSSRQVLFSSGKTLGALYKSFIRDAGLSRHVPLF